MTEPETPAVDSYRPELPDWGSYLRWPSDGVDWIHPQDIAVVRQLIPSRRVFRRSQWDGEFYHLHYGETTFRVRPSMWVRVPDIDLDVGQQVELLSCHQQNDPGIYHIADIHFVPANGQIEYALQSDDLRLERGFSRDDLRPLHVKYELRSGYYDHPPATASIPDDVDLLDVGKLTSHE
ncbi:MAG: hypothetical protein ABI557_05700 [Aureliella sp.]